MGNAFRGCLLALAVVAAAEPAFAARPVKRIPSAPPMKARPAEVLGFAAVSLSSDRPPLANFFSMNGPMGSLVEEGGPGKWVPAFQLAGTGLHSAQILSTREAYALGSRDPRGGPGLFRSDDQGKSWARILRAPEGALSLYFVDRQTGYLGGPGGQIHKTTDGGETWTSWRLGESAFRGLYFLDAALGYVVGDGGAIYKTFDGGETWHAQASGTSQPLHAVSFQSEEAGYAVGGRGTIVKTVNGGATWEPQANAIRQDLLAVLALGDSAYAVGRESAVFKSSGADGIWKEQSGDGRKLDEVHFANARGDAARAGVFTASSQSLQKKAVVATRPSLQLGLLGSRGLWYQIPEEARVRVRLIDPRGRSRDIVNATRPGGRHSVSWPQGLAPGIYFVDLRAGTLRASARVALTR